MISFSGFVAFTEEVLNRGIGSFQPSHLSSYWLDVLAREAEAYLEQRSGMEYLCFGQVVIKALSTAHGDEQSLSKYELEAFAARYAAQLLQEKEQRQCPAIRDSASPGVG